MVTHLGWRSIFLINLPIGLIGIYLALRYVAPHGGSHRRSLDWAGQGAVILALAALTMALTEAAPLGWEHGLVRGGFLLAMDATIGFIWIEVHSQSPMLPLELFRIPTFAAASVAGVVVNFAYYGLIFVFSLFFQIQQQLSPQLTGLAFLPMTVVLMAVNVLAGRLITRMGARLLMVLGLTLAAFGYLLLMPVRVDGSYWLLVVPMLLAASGTALMVPTMTNATFIGGCIARRHRVRGAQLCTPDRRHAWCGCLWLSGPGHRARGVHARHACVDRNFRVTSSVR